MLKESEPAATDSASVRDFLRSMTRFSWAQSLFGFQQVVGVLKPGTTAESFAQVSRVAEAELSESVRNFFRFGNQVQRETVDTLCGRVSPFQPRQASQPGDSAGPTSQSPDKPASASATPAGSRPTSPAGPLSERPAYRVSGGQLNQT